MNLEPTLAKPLESWQDGGLPETEEAALLQQLGSDPELRRRFAEQVAMLGAVRAAAEQSPRWLALFDVLEKDDGEADVEILSFEAATMEWIAPTKSWYQLPPVWVLAAAVILLLVGPFWLKPKWINNPSKRDMQVVEEFNADYPEIKQPPRPMLALPHFYDAEVMTMGPLGYWRFGEIRNHEVTNEVMAGARLQVAGTAAIAKEGGGNHSGALIQPKQSEFFHMAGNISPMLKGDFSISLFAQFEWLQNFAFTATRFDAKFEGNSFILQSYAAFRRTGLDGTGLHAVLYDPPAWDGGIEVFGNTLLRPRHWQHITTTRKGDQLTLYLDGLRVGSEPIGSMPLNFRDIFVGRPNGNATQSRQQARGLVGHIDELAVFPRTLTEDEIRKLAVSEKWRMCMAFRVQQQGCGSLLPVWRSGRSLDSGSA